MTMPNTLAATREALLALLRAQAGLMDAQALFDNL